MPVTIKKNSTPVLKSQATGGCQVLSLAPGDPLFLGAQKGKAPLRAAGKCASEDCPGAPSLFVSSDTLSSKSEGVFCYLVLSFGRGMDNITGSA